MSCKRLWQSIGVIFDGLSVERTIFKLYCGDRTSVMTKIKSDKNYTHEHMREDMLTKVHWCG